MHVFLKGFLKNLLERSWPVSASLRYLLFLRQSRRDALLVEKVAATLGLAVLSCHLRTPGHPKKDTLFILAGGSSVNELSPANWGEVDQGLSIGINFWPIHPYVPDILTSETDSKTPSNQFLNTLLAHPAIMEKSPAMLMLRTLWPPVSDVLPVLPPVFAGKTWVYGRANLVTRRLENLHGDLRKVIKAVKLGRVPPPVLPDNGSSVARLTFYGIAQGFKRIVWVGVDQNSGHYFWTEPPVPSHFEKAAKEVPRTTGEPHSTSSSVNRSFSNDHFLRALAQTLADDFDTQIYVSSATSSLSDTVPVFAWQNSKAD